MKEIKCKSCGKINNFTDDKIKGKTKVKFICCKKCSRAITIIDGDKIFYNVSNK